MFYSDLETYKIEMQDNQEKKYTFILDGICFHSPNKSSISGYGSDDWLFSCKCDEKDCILRFSCSAEGGAIWDCIFISLNEAMLLSVAKEELWSKILYSNYSKSKISRLHPTDINSAKYIIKNKYSKMGPLTDMDFYGL